MVVYMTEWSMTQSFQDFLSWAGVLLSALVAVTKQLWGKRSCLALNFRLWSIIAGNQSDSNLTQLITAF